MRALRRRASRSPASSAAQCRRRSRSQRPCDPRCVAGARRAPRASYPSSQRDSPLPPASPHHFTTAQGVLAESAFVDAIAAARAALAAQRGEPAPAAAPAFSGLGGGSGADADAAAAPFVLHADALATIERHHALAAEKASVLPLRRPVLRAPFPSLPPAPSETAPARPALTPNPLARPLSRSQLLVAAASPLDAVARNDEAACARAARALGPAADLARLPAAARDAAALAAAAVPALLTMPLAPHAVGESAGDGSGGAGAAEAEAAAVAGEEPAPDGLSPGDLVLRDVYALARATLGKLGKVGLCARACARERG